MSAGSFRSARSICLLSQKRYNELPNCSWSVTTTRVGGFGSSRNSNHIGSRFCSSVSQRYVANCSSTYSHVIINNNRPFISNNCRYFNTAKATSNISRPDPFARRPNQKCDPYGQGGKPLSMADAQKLLSTVDKEWKLDIPSQEEDEEREGKTGDDEVEASLPATQAGAVDETSGSSKDDGEDASYRSSEIMIVPKSISREFYHTEFIDGSKFASKIAALSQMNNHYPTITLHRKVLKKQKQWVSVTKITCHTNVLNGLSYNDFHLAMVRSLKCRLQAFFFVLLHNLDGINKTFSNVICYLDFLLLVFVIVYFLKKLSFFSICAEQINII